MLGFLNPRRVAAKKLAKTIAQRQLASPPPPEARGTRVEPALAEGQLDALELLLEEELGKYGIGLV